MRRVGDTGAAHQAVRGWLRTLGGAMAIVGALLTLVGLASFFSAFGSFGPPRYFWCAFVGLPLLGIGLNLLGQGFAGRIARYRANAYTPVVRDTLNTLARETGPAQRAVRRVFREEGVTRDTVRCPECGARHRADANFCTACGSPFDRPPCPRCGQPADPGARFCAGCGEALS